LGTCAENILSHLKKTAPKLYDITTYTIIEISEKLSLKQKEKIQEHGNAFVRNISIFDWNETVEEHCFIIALEVIDNLPHDKVVILEKEQCETYIIESANHKFFEEYAPVSDPVIQSCLALTPRGSLRQLIYDKFIYPFMPSLNMVISHPAFVPTGCLLFLEILGKYFPKHAIVLADFSKLSDVIDAKNAPVVQQKQGNFTKSFPTYLVPKGSCDIFFPTDFDYLKKMYMIVTGKKKQQIQIMDNNRFITKFQDSSQTLTKSGYNPMLQEYVNMKYLLSE